MSSQRILCSIWDRNEYDKEAGIQLNNQNTYKSVEFKDRNTN